MEKEAIYLPRLKIWVNKWFVPCGFIHFGEDPQHRTETLVRKALNASARSIKLSNVVWYVQPSEYYPGYNHWHVDFVFTVEGLELGRKPAWWDSLEYVPASKLRAKEIGMAGADVLKKLRIVKL